MAAHNAIGFIDRNVCAYRIHGSNLSRTRDPRLRVRHLVESRDVAMRRAAMFEEPYRTLLLAQAHVIGAKIGFLERRVCAVSVHLAGYALLSLLSRMRRRPAPQVLEQA